MEDLAAMFEAQHERIVRFCERRGLDRHTAEDVASQVWCEAAERLARGQALHIGYLWLVVRSRLADGARRSARRPTTWLDPHATEAGDLIGQAEERADAAQTLAAVWPALSPAQRAALRLAADGHDGASTAVALGVSPGAAKATLYRARRRAMQVLEGGER
jgi:RNA polymerase sigma-70 factor (ECF subfamily)